MTVQWTVHIPQAMQRHGVSIAPCAADTPRVHTVACLVQQANLELDMPPRRPDEAA